MNPWAALAALILWVSSLGAVYTYGTSVGKDGEVARVAELKQVIEDTRELARQGAASEIAKIKVRNTTIQGKVETITRDNPVYRDCRHDPDTLRLLNDALTGKTSSAGRDSGGSLPGVDRDVR